MSTITTTGLEKEYPNGVRGVDGVSLTIEDGEFFALLGPSGCGKTTLLRSIAGLEAITGGRLDIGEVEATNLAPGDRGVAMVFQDYALFPHMDVADNIAYPLKIKKIAKAVRRNTAKEVGGELSLSGLMERRPGQLSGGQQQRVALARAVATRPGVLLLDEPLSNLDARLRLEARTFLKELQRDLGVTTVFVTHDQAEALALADRMAVMRAGKIEQVGTPREVFGRPATVFVASFIGSIPMNLIPGQITADGVLIDGHSIPMPQGCGDVPVGTEVMWGARPEYLRWSEENQDGALPVRVVLTENLGASILVTAHIGGAAKDSAPTRLQFILAQDDEIPPGTPGYVVAPPHRTLVFDAATEQALYADAPALVGA